MYEKALSPKYAPFYLQRTNHKKDGLAVFVKRDYTIRSRKLIEFNDQGDRVALLLHVVSPTGAEFLLANTHLTFPHNSHDEKVLRLAQIQSVHSNIEQYIKQNNLTNIPVIVCGDMNTPVEGEKSCVVNQFLSKKQYVGVDFIYLKDDDRSLSSHLYPIDSFFFPRELEADIIDH
eukprot:gene8436-9923_t